VDAAVPIGRGQRELIVGDRQTGKTAIAVDAILNQKDSGVLSVYCAIGQRASAVARVVQDLRDAGALDRTIVVAAAGDDAPGLQFIAPYAATTMAEHFMAQGRDVLIVYDDLTRHARAYRELSLLLRRPPGREAYPGDIFYIHSRLLERATHLREEHSGGSLTALPIVETQAQNISAYIPTNLISITDGQIYLSPDLFEKGHLPAIDVGLSVSRVGGKAQRPAFRAVAGRLRLTYSQFEELESFARFGTQLDEETRAKLTRGQRVRAVLTQKEHDHFTVPEQIAVLLAATEGLLDDIEADAVPEAEEKLRRAAREDLPDLADEIASGEPLSEERRADLIAALRRALGKGGDTHGDA
jgi:F-type H+-transporting ATPase subunit alpha